MIARPQVALQRSPMSEHKKHAKALSWKIRKRLWKLGLRSGPARWLEALHYAFVRPKKNQRFFIVSSERNAGDAALRCLDSVYAQRYDPARVTHVFIDDASDDGTHERITAWLDEHPDHRVRYIHNDTRVGGTPNLQTGLRMAPADSIALRLDGDDWLPDPNVFRFFNKVYANDDVWTTYNTMVRYKHGSYRPAPPAMHRVPGRVTAANTFRAHHWCTGHLSTLRTALLRHVDDDRFLDPETNAPLPHTNDKAVVLSLLELAGTHARHIHRITYVYNISNVVNPDPAYETADRLNALPRYRPLRSLSDPPGSAGFDPPLDASHT
jgi:glycosyltransferase involved in cell wall biosynthesis